LALESHRSKTIIVGEDLGTVPRQVRSTMARHGLHCTYVVQYELNSSPRRVIRAIPANAVASLNTHDMPPFAAFWQGLDIEDQLELGLLGKADAQMERKTRRALKQALVSFLLHKGWGAETPTTPQAVLRAALSFLSASRARGVLVNLEDLWLETQPQNVPGTRDKRPNWRRKARHSFEAFSRMPEVVATLQALDYIRKH
jgi:4-alpha-glucanotransferase